MKNRDMESTTVSVDDGGECTNEDSDGRDDVSD